MSHQAMRVRKKGVNSMRNVIEKSYIIKVVRAKKRKKKEKKKRTYDI